MNTDYMIFEPAMAHGDPLLAIEDQNQERSLRRGEAIQDPPIAIFDKAELTKPFQLRHAHRASFLLVSPDLRAAFGEEFGSAAVWLPTRVTIAGSSCETHSLLHVRRRIRAVDAEESEVDWEEDDPVLADSIHSLALDSEVLTDIPLQDRLIFRLDEDPQTILIHSSISAKLDPLSFNRHFKLYAPAEWNSEIGFQDRDLLLG